MFLAMTVKKEINKGLNQTGNEYIDNESMIRTREKVFPIVIFVVISSIIVHGITVPILNIGSRIDIERLPSIASIGDQVARLPVVGFVESLTLENESHGHIGKKKEKMKAKFVRIPSSSDQEEQYQNTDVDSEEEEEKEDNKTFENNVNTESILIEIDKNESRDLSISSTSNSQSSNDSIITCNLYKQEYIHHEGSNNE